MKTFFCLLVLVACCSNAQQLSIIPKPVESTVQKGRFNINAATVIVLTNDGLQPSADFLNNYLKTYYGFSLKTAKQAKTNFIHLGIKVFTRPPDNDGYNLTVSPKNIEISGDTYAGSFHAIQSLIQLLPLQKKKVLDVQCCTVTDYPRFKYRGLHLDAGRHFMPVAFVKKYIDFIALNKLNYFHWHLTEDQGWRIEIKKYPRLTEVGAWRNGTIIGRYPGKSNDNTKHGGYYTQEEIKEVVKYAADRYITVIPEIELPGHGSAAIAAYPYLSCFPEEPTIKYFPKSCTWGGDTTGKQVQQTWGVFSDVFCAGKDSTFDFLQDVLDEVMALFPSPYIHIGGDECPKENWKRCPNCLLRMQRKGLKDAHELQSYFIQRIEKYINSKGRKIIGWDEILEGGLAPNATVMSWRGEEGGITAAKQNHDVIMTPGNPVYFDHTQSTNEDSVTIGGYNPIEKVYAYDPVPAVLTEEQGKHILGAQANVWTEYMDNGRKVEYMIFPRLAALSEVLWSQKDKKDWSSFEKRLITQFKRYDFTKTNYSKAYFDLKATVLPAEDNNGVLWKIESNYKNGTITVSPPGIFWPKSHISKEDSIKIINTKNVSKFIYKNSFKINSNGYYRVTLDDYSKKESLLAAIEQKFSFSKSTGKKITLTNQPSKSYPGDGAFTLVNGVQNEKGLSKSKEFLGFEGTDCEAVIDLGKTMEIKEVIAHVFEENGSWIYRPKSIEVFVSNDGLSYQSAGKSDIFIEIYPLRKVGVSFAPLQTRFVKVLIKNYGTIPAGNPGGGHPAWLFVDEIEVN
ncbi:MAG: beta-N-acetylhexosaminidase [Sphingobacteriales bacterium]|nr:MAG: beta-N-acetylhexosaminidase [Sphingobacteriales bacterium]